MLARMLAALVLLLAACPGESTTMKDPPSGGASATGTGSGSSSSTANATAPGGGTIFIGPHLLLPADKARHVGEAVAMVVANTKAQALDAAEAVEIAYEELPFVLHSERAIERGAPVLWPEAPDNICVDTRFGDGEANAAASTGD